ncbi:MAG: diacylglycerol kinase family protein [Chlorobi bacterium]|nr:diacylglycerol kinase family protein [Chlorobiota bacterium]
MADNTSEKSALKKRARSFVYAFRGIATVFKTQRNMQIHVIIALLVVVAGIWLELQVAEWLFIVFATGFVFSAEIFNSATEALTDLVSPGYNDKAGKIKDMAAGAVLVAAITAAIIGLFIFIPHLTALL